MAAIVQWKIENAREFSVASRHDSGWNCKMTFVRSSLFAVVQLPRVSVKKNRAKDRELVLYIPFLYCNQFPCLGCYIGCCIQQASISWDTNDNNPTKCPPILHQGFHSIGVCHIIAIQKKHQKVVNLKKNPEEPPFLTSWISSLRRFCWSQNGVVRHHPEVSGVGTFQLDELQHTLLPRKIFGQDGLELGVFCRSISIQNWKFVAFLAKERVFHPEIEDPASNMSLEDIGRCRICRMIQAMHLTTGAAPQAPDELKVVHGAGIRCKSTGKDMTRQNAKNDVQLILFISCCDDQNLLWLNMMWSLGIVSRTFDNVQAKHGKTM